PQHIRAVRLAIRALVHVVAVRGGGPTPVHQHGPAIGETERGNEVDPRNALVAAPVPQPLVRVIVDPAGPQPAVADRVRGERPPCPPCEPEWRARAGAQRPRAPRPPLPRHAEPPPAPP